MKGVTLTVSPEVAKKLLSICEAEVLELDVKLEWKRRELEQLRNAVNHGTEPVESLPLSVSKNPESGRAPKGASERAILAFLESHKGSGWRAAEIAEKTGTSLTTTIRILKKLGGEGKVSSTGHTWGASA